MPIKWGFKKRFIGREKEVLWGKVWYNKVFFDLKNYVLIRIFTLKLEPQFSGVRGWGTASKLDMGGAYLAPCRVV